MGHLYYVRHGETVCNTENMVCGAIESPLTEKGREQARQAGEEIKRQGLQIDCILHSPLGRAAETAGIIAEITGIPLVPEPRLIEQSFGKWETADRYNPEFRQDMQCFAKNYDGGESMLRLAQRIYNLLDELKKKPDKVFLLVAHNAVSRSVNSYFNDLSNAEYASFGLKNGEIRRFDF